MDDIANHFPDKNAPFCEILQLQSQDIFHGWYNKTPQRLLACCRLPTFGDANSGYLFRTFGDLSMTKAGNAGPPWAVGGATRRAMGRKWRGGKEWEADFAVFCLRAQQSVSWLLQGDLTWRGSSAATSWVSVCLGSRRCVVIGAAKLSSALTVSSFTIASKSNQIIIIVINVFNVASWIMLIAARPQVSRQWRSMVIVTHES